MNAKRRILTTVGSNIYLICCLSGIAQGQTDNSCFMVNDMGNTIDLSALCGQPSVIKNNQGNQNQSSPNEENTGVSNRNSPYVRGSEAIEALPTEPSEAQQEPPSATTEEDGSLERSLRRLRQGGSMRQR